MASASTNQSDLAAIASLLPPRARLSKAEFLEWALATEAAVEWVDGEVITMAPANRDNMESRRWFDALLYTFVRRKKLGRVGDDMLIDLDGQRRLRVPDMFFVAKARTGIIGLTLLTAPPDLVLEVISPDSQSRDRREKYLEYEAFGVLEYWIIDPISQNVEAYSLNAQGKYEPILPVEGKLASRVVPGFWILMQWLWSDTRPDEDEAIALMEANP